MTPKDEESDDECDSNDGNRDNTGRITFVDVALIIFRLFLLIYSRLMD